MNNYQDFEDKYINIKQGIFCCKKLMVLAKYHDGMEVDNESGRISVYAPKEDTFWGRHINLQYFEFDYCPYCGRKLY